MKMAVLFLPSRYLSWAHSTCGDLRLSIERMPPKGDVVTDNELQLSSSLSGLSLLSRTNELSTWNDQPARVYRVTDITNDLIL